MKNQEIPGGWEKTTRANSTMTQMLGLSDKDFKAVIIPAAREVETGESLERGRQRLQSRFTGPSASHV